MGRALLKKQLMEQFSFLIHNRKNGKRRTPIGAFLMVLLALALYLSLAFFMMWISYELAAALLSSGFMASHANDWLYFALMGLTAILVGIFGSIFTAYNTLYRGGDNEMLLAMPIPPSKILLARMESVYLMALLYISVAWLPCCIVYWTHVWQTVTTLVFPLILLFFLAMLVTVLTCILGWVVAMVIRRVKHKNVLIVTVSVVCFGVYYYVCMRMNALLSLLVANAEAIGETVKRKIWLIRQLGLAAAGEIPAMIAFCLSCVILFLLCWYVLSRTFFHITMTAELTPRAVYKETTAKVNEPSMALLKKELRFFAGCPVYMMNTGLGILILPFLGVLALIKAETIRSTVEMISGEFMDVYHLLPILAAAAVCMILSMNVISSPSVSLEGKNLWIIRSMPVDTVRVLQAKARMHILLNLVPGVIGALLISVAVGISWEAVLLVILQVMAYICFTAEFGLAANLLFPNVHWTSVTVPVKQGISVIVAIFGSWIICALAAGGFLMIGEKVGNIVYLILSIVFYLLLAGLLRRWIAGKGVRIFESL